MFSKLLVRPIGLEEWETKTPRALSIKVQADEKPCFDFRIYQDPTLAPFFREQRNSFISNRVLLDLQNSFLNQSAFIFKNLVVVSASNRLL